LFNADSKIGHRLGDDDMKRLLKYCVASVSLAGLLAVGPTFAVAQTAAPQTNVEGQQALRVGMPRTFFHDVSPVLVKTAIDPLAILIRKSTGMTSKVVVGTDAFALAHDLGERKLQLAVFHSFEFGWAQQKYPELRPLMLAGHAQRPVAAYVLVRKDSDLHTFADLKGKDLAVPKRSREPTRLYLEHSCKGGSKEFFSHVVSSRNVEWALDELTRSNVHAVAVDAIGLEFYKDLKPGCFAKFRVLSESGAFPPSVIAYWQGGLDAKTLALLRDCLLNAHATPLGAEMMRMWEITSFEPVPVDYSDAVAACIKQYPCPH
jgi:ABC-type phosphate/phosphonate transport system substrate-binding protein